MVIAVMMKEIYISEMSVFFNETTRRYIPGGYHIQGFSVYDLRNINLYCSLQKRDFMRAWQK
jgi:hypothetical protein